MRPYMGVESSIGTGRRSATFQQRYLPMRHRLAAFFVGLLLGGAAWSSPAQTTLVPVRLTDIHGPRTVHADSVANYRAAVAATSTKPIAYTWDFGDGIVSEGIVVAHRYDGPGTYTMTLAAANRGGRDTLRTTVVVTEPPPPPVPASASDEPAPATLVASTESTTSAASSPPSRSVAEVARRSLYGSAPIGPKTTGYTWVLASDLWRQRLERSVLDYVLRGLRVELYTDASGGGSPAYRIIAGHFSTVEEARAARRFLPANVKHPILHEFSEP